MGDNVSEGTLDRRAGRRRERGRCPAPAKAEVPKAQEAAPPAAPAAAAPAASGGGTVDVKVPDIGDFKDIPVIEIAVKVGDKVEKEQIARHARIRQGHDGRAVARRGHGQGTEGQARRHRLRRHVDRRAGKRRRAAAAAPAAKQEAPKAEVPSDAPAKPVPQKASAVGACAAAHDARRRRRAHVEPCVAFRAQVRARPGRRSVACDRFRSEGPHHARRRHRVRQGRDDGPGQGTGGSRGACRRWRRRVGPAAVAEGRLHQVRPGRSRSRSRASRRSRARTCIATG